MADFRRAMVTKCHRPIVPADFLTLQPQCYMLWTTRAEIFLSLNDEASVKRKREGELFQLSGKFLCNWQRRFSMNRQPRISLQDIWIHSSYKSENCTQFQSKPNVFRLSSRRIRVKNNTKGTLLFLKFSKTYVIQIGLFREEATKKIRNKIEYDRKRHNYHPGQIWHLAHKTNAMAIGLGLSGCHPRKGQLDKWPLNITEVKTRCNNVYNLTVGGAKGKLLRVLWRLKLREPNPGRMITRVLYFGLRDVEAQSIADIHEPHLRLYWEG